MTGHVIVGRPEQKLGPYKKKTVETMTDSEIRHKLCNVKGGCTRCEVFHSCRYGAEAKRRGLV